MVDHEEDIDQLLRDCDLEKKINANASTLSGGQKRKLQLAIGLVGGSKIVLADEVGIVPSAHPTADKIDPVHFWCRSSLEASHLEDSQRGSIRSHDRFHDTRK